MLLVCVCVLCGCRDGDGDCCAVSAVGLVNALDICPLSGRSRVSSAAHAFAMCTTHICGFRVLERSAALCWARGSTVEPLESGAFSEPYATPSARLFVHRPYRMAGSTVDRLSGWKTGAIAQYDSADTPFRNRTADVIFRWQLRPIDVNSRLCGKHRKESSRFKITIISKMPSRTHSRTELSIIVFRCSAVSEMLANYIRNQAHRTNRFQHKDCRRGNYCIPKRNV